MGRKRMVMIIDPDPASRAELEALLKGAPLAVVADSGYGVEASSLAEETHPDLVLAAVEAPVDRALQTIQAVMGIVPESPIIGYSSITDMQVMRQVMQIGVKDFLPRPIDPAELAAAIDRMEPEEADVDAGADEVEPTAAAQPAGAARPAPPTRAAGVVLTVFGAKGGIGKSTIATNLAAAIAHDTEFSVLLMDMDARFGDIAIMMDIEPRFTVADLASHAHELDREMFRSALMRHDSGVQILAAPKHPGEWGDITAEQMKGLIQYGARLFDFVILDTPGTFNDLVATAIEVADRVLMVSSLDMASIKDSAYMLDLLEAEEFPPDRLLLTINQVNRVNSLKIADIPKVVHHDVFWEISYDEQVLHANQVGTPVVVSKPKSRAAKQMRALAMQIVGPEGGAAQEKRSGGFLRWLFLPLPFRRGARA